jgi:hypothetical protein
MMQLFITVVVFLITAALGSGSSARDISSLSKWLKNSGVQIHDKIKWKDNGLNDYGLVLTSSVPLGTVLLKVPRTLVLDSQVVKESFMRDM